MKKILEIIGIITLFIGSFMYNEQVSTTAKLSDNLLEEIKNQSSIYKKEPIEAIIRDDTIIPGENGKEVDIKESYEKMKEIGYFNDKLLVYNDIIVKNPLKTNQDKYIISGCKNKKEIALVFKENKNINDILKILNQEQIKATFLIDSNYLERNHDYVIKLLKNGHTIGNLNANQDYNNTDFIWMKTIFINSGYQKNNYCVTFTKNTSIINTCSKENSYTILPNILKNPFIDIRKNLANGGIYTINKTIDLKEIENIIKYIKAKGYKLTSLEHLLKE